MRRFLTPACSCPATLSPPLRSPHPRRQSRRLGDDPVVARSDTRSGLATSLRPGRRHSPDLYRQRDPCCHLVLEFPHWVEIRILITPTARRTKKLNQAYL